MKKLIIKITNKFKMIKKIKQNSTSFLKLEAGLAKFQIDFLLLTERKNYNLFWMEKEFLRLHTERAYNIFKEIKKYFQ